MLSQFSWIISSIIFGPFYDFAVAAEVLICFPIGRPDFVRRQLYGATTSMVPIYQDLGVPIDVLMKTGKKYQQTLSVGHVFLCVLYFVYMCAT